jgi:ABC-type amino acid transport substrate-binding protein
MATVPARLGFQKRRVLSMAYYKYETVDPQVRVLKERLADLQLYTGAIDQNFDRETETAVKAFQEKNNIVSDGEVGPNTWKTLFKDRPFVAPSQDIKDVPILIFGNFSLSLKTLVPVFLFLIGILSSGGSWLVTKLFLQPTQDRLNDTLSTLQETKAERDRFLAAYNTYVNSTNKPELTFPESDQAIVGRQVEFQWVFKSAAPDTHYLLELLNLDKVGPDRTPFTIPVPTSSRMMMVFPFPEDGLNAEYLWRIAPGELIGAPEGQIGFSQGEWSPYEGQWSSYGHFWIYSSVVERVKRTKTITVGISPTTYGLLDQIDPVSGKLTGFEPWLISFIAQSIPAELLKGDPAFPAKATISVETVNEDWSKLLDGLRNAKFDMVVASVTATRSRAKKVDFSTGYFPVDEVLVARREDRSISDFSSLAGRSLGVQADTTNANAVQALRTEKFARHGFRSYAFQVDSTFGSADELIAALLDKRVDLAMVDNIALSRYRGSVCVVDGEGIHNDLSAFRRENFVDGHEVYAIAFSDGQFRDMVDEILTAKSSVSAIASHRQSEAPIPALAKCGESKVQEFQARSH